MQNSSDSTRTRNDLELNRLGQLAWRNLCRSPVDDPQEAVERFCREHPGIVPECFRSDDDQDPLEHKHRRNRGIELVYGKPQNGVRLGGLVGRCRVLAAEPLEHRIVHFRDIDAPSKFWQARGIEVQLIQSLAACTLAQFSVETVDAIAEVLEHILPTPCFYAIERGALNEALHLHILCKPGTTSLGRRLRVVRDDNLITVAAYLSKRPLFTPETPRRT